MKLEPFSILTEEDFLRLLSRQNRRRLLAGGLGMLLMTSIVTPIAFDGSKPLRQFVAARWLEIDMTLEAATQEIGASLSQFFFQPYLKALFDNLMDIDISPFSFLTHATRGSSEVWNSEIAETPVKENTPKNTKPKRELSDELNANQGSGQSTADLTSIDPFHSHRIPPIGQFTPSGDEVTTSSFGQSPRANSSSRQIDTTYTSNSAEAPTSTNNSQTPVKSMSDTTSSHPEFSFDPSDREKEIERNPFTSIANQIPSFTREPHSNPSNAFQLHESPQGTSQQQSPLASTLSSTLAPLANQLPALGSSDSSSSPGEQSRLNDQADRASSSSSQKSEVGDGTNRAGSTAHSNSDAGTTEKISDQEVERKKSAAEEKAIREPGSSHALTNASSPLQNSHTPYSPGETTPPNTNSPLDQLDPSGTLTGSGVNKDDNEKENPLESNCADLFTIIGKP